MKFEFINQKIRIAFIKELRNLNQFIGYKTA
jgi:hypothetical protein